MQLEQNEGPIGKIITLLMNMRVQNELDIVRPQLKSIKEAFGKLREKSMLEIKAMQSLPDSEKRKAIRGLMGKLSTGADSFLAEVLRPDQFKRFQQVRLQHEGIDFFLNESACSELSLTEEQSAALKVKVVLYKGIKSTVAGSREKKMQEIMDMLTEQQTAKWREMFGEPFDFGETEIQTSDAPSGVIQSPLSQGPQSQVSPSRAPYTRQRGPSVPAGDPFADDDVF